MKILVIDDFIITAWIIKKNLGNKHTLEQIDDVDKFLENISMVLNYEVIILDVMMQSKKSKIPETLFGISILKKIRGISNIPIILTTAYSYSSIKDFIKDIENVYYLNKQSIFEDFSNIFNAIEIKLSQNPPTTA